MTKILDEECLWTANDVARFLNVSRSWVYFQSGRGALPSHKFLGALRFFPDEIKSFARGQQVQRARVVPVTITKQHQPVTERVVHVSIEGSVEPAKIVSINNHKKDG